MISTISAIFTGKREVKVGPKVLTLDPSLFNKNLIPSKNFQTMFLFPSVLPIVIILATLDHIWGSKGPKTSQKGPFCTC